MRGEKIEVDQNPLSLGAFPLSNTLLWWRISSTDWRTQQRSEALEFLGASPATQPYDNPDTERAFEYMKRGREERFQDL